MSNEFENEKREWVYDAFISYRHIQPDAFVAGSLHKILEAYKPPKSIFKGKNPEEIKRTKIKKVFRDEEELPLTSNLSDTIGYALENSEYLIAICSPRFGESLWCRKEVDTFIKLHGKEKVLTVLVEGEPSDSFPEELLYREVEITKPDGTTEIVKEPMEPLAANARGNSDKERVKLLKNESLRLMAPMFGVNFDDLKQRHREQKLRRTIRIVAAASAICLLFGIVSTTMAVKISNQNEQITQQNEQITQQNEQISLQADEIERQYEEALVSECTAATDLAISQLNAGNRIAAVKTAYDVFEQDGTDNIYMQKTEKVLSDALELYDLGEVFNPDRICKASSIIEDVQLSPNGKKMVVIDEGKNVTVWDSVTGEKLFCDYMGSNASMSSSNAIFKNNSQIFAMIQNELVLYDVDEGKKIFGIEMSSSTNMTYNAEKDVLFAASASEIYLVNGTTGEILETHEDIDTQSKEMYSFIKTMADISGEDKEYYAYSYASSSLEKDSSLIVIRSLSTGEIVKVIEEDDYSINKLLICGDYLYVSGTRVEPEYYKTLDMNRISQRINRYSITDTSVKPMWSYVERGVSSSDFVITGNQDMVACLCFEQLEFISNDTGELYKRFYLDTDGVYIRNYSDSNWISVVTRGGQCLNASPESQETYGASFFVPVCNNIHMMTMSGGYIAVIPYLSSEVTVYRTAPDRGRETVAEFDMSISKIRQGKDESELLIYTYDNMVHEFDKNDDKVIASSKTDVSKEDTDKENERISELGSYLEIIGIEDRLVNKVFTDKDEKFYFVVYKDRSFDIFRMGDDGKPIPGECESFGSCDLFDIRDAQISSDGKKLWIDGTTEGIIVNLGDKTVDEVIPAESMITAYIINLKYVDFDSKYVYCNYENSLIRFPLYEKDEIAKIAQNEVTEYVR